MKNIKYLVMALIAMAFVTSCDWLTLDNQPGYNAQVYGTLIDSETGVPVPSEIYATGSSSNISVGYMTVVELGWDAEVNQNWNVKNNGTYRNNLVFAGKYKMNTINANYYPAEIKFELNEGENKVDFTVTPYARVNEQNIWYDAQEHKIKATCTVEVADPSKTTSLEVRLCCYTDCFVGSGFNNCKNDAGAVNTNVVVDENGVANVELSIDIQNSANQTEFMYDRTHYVRIAALATGAGVNTSSRYNFGKTYSLKLDGSEAVEYNKW